MQRPSRPLPVLLFVLAAVTTPAAQEPAGAGPPPLRQVTVDLAQAPARALGLEVDDLLARDLDVLSVAQGTRRVDLLCTDEDLARLERLGLVWELVHEDLAGFYAERLAAGPPAEAAALGGWLSPPFGQGSMGGFYTWEEVGSVLQQVANAYPAIVSPRGSIGQSLEGRDLWYVKVSDSPGLDEAEPEVRFDAMHHAREPESMQAALWTLLWLVENYGSDPRATWIVDNREIWFLPVVNPDGYVYNQTTNPGGGGLWRKNRRNNGNGSFGVDLNRNYPFEWGADDAGSSPSPSSETYRGASAASEPEVQAMVSFLSSRSFRTALSLHTFSNYWLYPWGYVNGAPPNQAEYDELSVHATEENGYVYGPASVVLYLANGVTVDYDHAAHGTYAWTPEIGSQSDGFWPPPSRIVPLAEENREALLRTALAAGSYVRTLSLDLAEVGDGDGFFEAGESVELVVTARNTGVAATGGSASVGLSTASPVATAAVAAADLGTLPSFTTASNATRPLVLAIEASAAPGAKASFDVTLAWDGFVETTSQTIVVGEPVDFVRDDLEADLGWTATLPGDTATTGLWVRGVPVGTNSGGEPANPGADATPGAGTLCFATGNGSTSAGGDDVDDGFTTLLSPPIDLSGVASARLSYARWYADLTVSDDVFAVSISDDGGVTWVPLEDLTATANAWTRVSFLVDDYVGLTDEVRLRFVASDDPNNSVCEAGVDDLLVEVFDPEPRFNVFGRPAPGAEISFNTASRGGGIYGIFDSTGTGFFTFALVDGPLLLDPTTMVLILQGNVPAGGLARDLVSVPVGTGLSGTTRYYQALVAAPDGLYLTNRDEIAFE